MPIKIQVTASSGDAPAEIIMSGTVGDWGMQGKDLRNALDAVPAGKKINLRVNSGGGSVSDALEMYHAIKQRSADTTAYVCGYALSAGSVFPLSAGKVISPRGSVWMIHCASCATYGNAADKIKDAEMLKAHDSEMAAIYAAKTGKSMKAIKEAMDSETWMTSEEAMDFGLADESPDPGEDAINSASQLRVLAVIEFNVPERIRAYANKQSADCGTTQTMNKTKLVAFLKSKDIDASADWTDEQFESALNKVGATSAVIAPAVATAAVVAVNPATASVTIDDVKALRALLDAEKQTRIRAEVLRRGEGKIATAQIDFYVKNALQDETGTYAAIDALPTAQVGGAPAGLGVTISAENPLDKLKKDHAGKKGATARYEVLKSDWNELWKDAQARDERSGAFARVARGDVQASNSYSASLVTQFLLDGATTVLQNQWAALRGFQKDYGTDRYKPLATAQLKLVTSTDGSVQTNASNFESGDTTVGNVAIPVNQYTRSFHVTNFELNSGLRMEDILKINMSVFADTIIQKATTPITAANFGPGNALNNGLQPTVVAPGNWGWGNMQTLWGQLKKSPIHNVLLDGEYLAQLLNVPTNFQKTGNGPQDPGAWSAFGWENILLNTNWTAADPNVRGFACNPQAIGAVSGLPLLPPNIPGATLQESTITIPGPDITVAVYNWFSLATRTLWYSYDLMFGAQAVDTSAGIIIRSA